MIIPIIILGCLVVSGIWTVYSALNTDRVEFGYKYYPPKYSGNRKVEPGSFWFVIIVYSIAVISALCMLIGIIVSVK